jgi:hypothetical protein
LRTDFSKSIEKPGKHLEDQLDIFPGFTNSEFQKHAFSAASLHRGSFSLLENIGKNPFFLEWTEVSDPVY